MTDTKTPAPAAAKKAAPKARAKSKPDLDRLARLTAEMDGYGTGDLTNLIHRWETEEGLRIAAVRNGAGGNSVTLAGLKASSTMGTRGALRNWGNAARRALRIGGAA